MKLSYCLEVTQGPDKGLVKELTRRENIIGRGEDAALVLDDGQSSRHHCQVVITNQGARVKDLGSTNGTWLNGQRVDEAAVVHGDILRVGQSEMVLKVGEARTADQDQAVPAPAEAKAGFLASLGWRTQVMGLLLALTLACSLLVSLPLVNRHQQAQETEALERASVLTLALSALNREALSLNDEMLVDVKQVAKMEGVAQVYIYDRMGRIWAPLSQLHQVPSDPLSRKALGAEQFQVQNSEPGVYDLAQPIRVFNAQTGKFDKVGTARIVFSMRKLNEQRGGAWQSGLLGLVLSLLLAVAVGYLVALLAARPVLKLRDQVEAVLKGDAEQVPAGQATPALAQLTASINRGLAKLAQGPTDQTTAAPAAPAAQMAAAGPADFSLPLLAQAVDQPVLLVDADNQVTLANAAYAQAVGREAESIAGRHLLEAVPDQALLPPLLELVQAATAQPGQVQQRAVNDAQGRSVQIKVTALAAAPGQAAGLILVWEGLAATSEANA